MNAQLKLMAIRSKIKEANCDIIYLQETKKRILIQISLNPFVRRVLTGLNLFLLLGLQEARILSRKVAGLVVRLLLRMSMP
jgi:hypothetical protein